MSDANREQVTTLLNSVWTRFTNISKAEISLLLELNEITNGLLARTPAMAKDKISRYCTYEDVYHNAIKSSE
jgi:protease-4